MPSTSKKSKNRSKKPKKVKYISSAKKSIKIKSKKGTNNTSQEKQCKKRKVVFHINKPSESMVNQEQYQDDDSMQEDESERNEVQTIEFNQPKQNKKHQQQVINIETFTKQEDDSMFTGNKEGQIKKVETPKEFKALDSYNSTIMHKQHKDDSEDDYYSQSIDDDMRRNCHFKGEEDYEDEERIWVGVEHNQGNDKLEIIDSEKLSELLSSKKKNRYNNVISSMDEIVEEPISHQLNFDDEFQNSSSNTLRSQKKSSGSLSEYQNSQSQASVIQKPPSPINDPNSPSNQSSDPRHNLYSEFRKSNVGFSGNSSQIYHGNMHPKSHLIIESITYAQQNQEQNDILPDSDIEQTVINCTQSNLHSSEASDISDHNIIADEFSLEYPQVLPRGHKSSSNHSDLNDDNSSEGTIAQVSMRECPQQNIIQVQELLKNQTEVTQNSMSDDLSQDPQMIHEETDSQSEGEEDINSCQYQETEIDASQDNERQYFNHTLTNMRIAFGSEQKIRENSVKTLEKMENSNEESRSGKTNEEKSSVFEKKSFQDFSLKKFTELMQVKNMKKFEDSMQKTFREYNKAKILSMSDKKNENNNSSTPQKARYISPRRFSKRELELDRIGSEHMRLNSEHKMMLLKQFNTSSSSLTKHNNTTILYKTNMSMDKYKKERTMQELSESAANSIQTLEFKILSPKKRNDNLQSRHVVEQSDFESPEPSKSYRSKQSS